MDNPNPHLMTHFIDENGRVLFSEDGILALPLREGMKITVEGYEDAFQVVDWDYHQGQPVDLGGLRIRLKKAVPKRAGVW